MFVDISALLALLEGESPYAEQIAAILASARGPVMAAPAAAEALVVLTSRHGALGRTAFERLRVEIGLGIQPFTDQHAIATQRAYQRYGVHHIAGGLTVGECMTFAAAELAHAPLLAIGDAYKKTDLQFTGDSLVGYWPTLIRKQ